MYRILTLLLVALLAAPATAQTSINISASSLTPHGCFIESPVLVGWQTAATLIVDPVARAMALTTNEHVSSQLSQPPQMSDVAWLELIESLTTDGFRAGFAAVGLGFESEYYLALMLAYEINGDWYCQIIHGSRRFSTDQWRVTELIKID